MSLFACFVALRPKQQLFSHVGMNFCTVLNSIFYIFHIDFLLSLYTARPSFEYYRQVYFVHSGLKDQNLQVTISKSL